MSLVVMSHTPVVPDSCDVTSCDVTCCDVTNSVVPDSCDVTSCDVTNPGAS